jgi:hypothetical protein
VAKTDVAISEEDAFELAVAQMAEEDSNKGSENVSSNDIAIPYISILQALSPQVQEGDPDQIPGARASMLYQNVNMITWDGKVGLEFIPFAYDRHINEWVPREKGGGLAAVHDLNTPLMAQTQLNEKKIPTLPSGNALVDTAQHYGLYLHPALGTWEPAIVSMKSSALKKSRLWNSLISQQIIPGTEKTAPRWLYKWTIKTALEVKGDNRWFNFEIERAGMVTPDLYKKAKNLYEAYRSGQMSDDIKAAANFSQKQGVAGGASGVDDEIPF